MDPNTEPDAHVVWVHPAIMDDLVSWLNAGGIKLVRFDTKLHSHPDIPEYFMVPKDYFMVPKDGLN